MSIIELVYATDLIAASKSEYGYSFAITKPTYSYYKVYRRTMIVQPEKPEPELKFIGAVTWNLADTEWRYTSPINISLNLAEIVDIAQFISELEPAIQED